VCSRNIAKYGLKYKDISEIFKNNGMNSGDFFWHIYAVPIQEKINGARDVLKRWRLL
jgi:hypothetical protein